MAQQKDRAKAAIIGALVADAAVNPVHWIYDEEKMKTLLKKNKEIEFLSDWQCPYYKQDVGSFSCLGDQAFCLLKSIADNKGFKVETYAKDQYSWFGPDSQYFPNPSGRDEYPKKGPWMNGSITKSLDQLKAGNPLGGLDAAEGDSFSKIISLVALYAGHSDLPGVVEKAVRTTLNNDTSVETAKAYAKLLETCILTGDFDIEKWCEALPDGLVKKQVQDVIKSKNEDHNKAVRKFGVACALPGTFQGTIHCLLNCPKDFKKGVRLALSPGGENCTRSIGVGAILAAKGGVTDIPEAWLKKTLKGEEVVKYADQLNDIVL